MDAQGALVTPSAKVSKPFTQEPDWAVTSINLGLSELLNRSTTPCP
jgi:hypothetical protein